MKYVPASMQALLALTGVGISQDGCRNTHQAGDHGPFTISSSGVPREYLIHIPVSYQRGTRMPLVISYHGHGEDMHKQRALSNFANDTANPNMISVFPNGLDKSWEGPSYADNSVSDKVFTTDLLNHLKQNYCIDAARVYANGKSNGGGFVGTLACSPEHGGDFAAFAACSGAFYTDNNINYTDCHPARSPMPMMEFHGGADNTIRYTGGTEHGGIVPPIPDWLARWASRNGCAPGHGESQTWLYDHQVNHTVWDCNGHANVVNAYWIKDMGHDWPSTTPNPDTERDGHAPAPLDATPLILKFFQSHTKP